MSNGMESLYVMGGNWEVKIKLVRERDAIAHQRGPIKGIQLASQIDLFPTLFAQLGWDYNSNLFGQNVLKMDPTEERAFIGNYRKLGILKDNKVMILDELGDANFYSWNPVDNALSPQPLNEEFMKHMVSYYEVADDLYESGGLKLKNK